MCQNRDFPRLQNAFHGFSHVAPRSLMNGHQSAVGKNFSYTSSGLKRSVSLCFTMYWETLYLFTVPRKVPF